MNFPSLKSLKKIHDADHEKMRVIGKASRAKLLKISEKALNVARSGYSRTPTSYLRLIALNEAARTYGVEAAESVKGEFVEYLNAGDMYNPTIIRWRGNYYVRSLGDFVEAQERRGNKFK